MAILTIGGVAIPDPSKYNVMTSDLHADSSTRTESGRLVINRIRSKVYKIELSWPALKESQMATIQSTISPVTFNVTFLDTNGSYQTKEFYAGDVKCDPVRIFGNDKRWAMSFNLIEV